MLCTLLVSLCSPHPRLSRHHSSNVPSGSKSLPRSASANHWYTGAQPGAWSPMGSGRLDQGRRVQARPWSTVEKAACLVEQVYKWCTHHIKAWAQAAVAMAGPLAHRARIHVPVCLHDQLFLPIPFLAGHVEPCSPRRSSEKR